MPVKREIHGEIFFEKVSNLHTELLGFEHFCRHLTSLKAGKSSEEGEKSLEKSRLLNLLVQHPLDFFSKSNIQGTMLKKNKIEYFPHTEIQQNISNFQQKRDSI